MSKGKNKKRILELQDERRLSALLSLYNNVLTDIIFYQNQGDSTSMINVIPVVIVPLLEIFEVNTTIISIICLFAPLIQCLSLQRGLQAHTFVAMLRGYAANIEESINEVMQERHFLYNSVLIDEYIASQKVVKSKGLKTSWLMTVLLNYTMLCVCILFFIYFNPNQPWWVFMMSGGWFVLIAILITKLCIDLSKKEHKRLAARDLAKEILKEDYCEY